MHKCECGNEVSSNARFCPKCGHRFTSGPVKALLVFISLLVAGVIIRATIDSSGPNAVQPRASAVTTPATTPAQSSATPPCGINSQQFDECFPYDPSTVPWQGPGEPSESYLADAKIARLSAEFTKGAWPAYDANDQYFGRVFSRKRYTIPNWTADERGLLSVAKNSIRNSPDRGAYEHLEAFSFFIRTNVGALRPNAEDCMYGELAAFGNELTRGDADRSRRARRCLADELRVKGKIQKENEEFDRGVKSWKTPVR